MYQSRRPAHHTIHVIMANLEAWCHAIRCSRTCSTMPLGPSHYAWLHEAVPSGTAAGAGTQQQRQAAYISSTQ